MSQEKINQINHTIRHQTGQLVKLKLLFDNLNSRKNTLYQQVFDAKTRLDSKPEMDDIFKHIHHEIHQRKVEDLSILLTHLTSDVMGSMGGQVKLELNLEKQKPELDILIDKSNKDRDYYYQKISKSGEGVITVTPLTKPYEWKETDKGISFIKLVNLRGHSASCFEFGKKTFFVGPAIAKSLLEQLLTDLLDNKPLEKYLTKDVTNGLLMIEFANKSVLEVLIVKDKPDTITIVNKNKEIQEVKNLSSFVFNHIFDNVEFPELATYFNFWQETKEQPTEYYEDAYDGNGGALTNILSTGLRAIAVAANSQRKFLTLDEPDCWIQSEKIPNFAKVVSDLSSKAGLQTMLISHHPFSIFEQNANIVRLMRNHQGKIVADILNGENHSWEKEDQGIRGIRLINFYSHEDTYIPFCKGVTALIGDNNLGKSVVIKAFHAVCLGKSSDRSIMHGKSQASVELYLEDGLVLKWTRDKKGSPKETYILLDEHGNILDKTGSAVPDVPDFAKKVLKMDLVEDIDIHFGDQKDPVFLLNKPASMRAKILSLGTEASYITQYNDEYKAMVREDRETVKKGEMELTLIQEKLNKLTPDLIYKIETGFDLFLEEALEKCKKIELNFQNLSQLKEKATNLSKVDAQIKKLSPFKTIDFKSIKPEKWEHINTTINQLSSINQFIIRMEKLLKDKNKLYPIAKLDTTLLKSFSQKAIAESINNLMKLNKDIQNIHRLNQMYLKIEPNKNALFKLKSDLNSLPLDTLREKLLSPSRASFKQKAIDLKTFLDQIALLKTQIHQHQLQKQKIEEALTDMEKNVFKGICPTCANTLGGKIENHTH